MGDLSKNQKEMMLTGQLYFANGPELMGDRFAARHKAKKYNDTDPEQSELRNTLLTEYMGSIGKDCFIETPFRFDYGYNIYIGNRVYMNFNVTILDCGRVDIGDDVMFAPNVQLYTATHPTDPELRCYPNLWEQAKPIKIGNKVWLGGGVIVLPGVTIGDNTTIGAGSVVTKDIPANCIAVGNPCKIVKYLPVNGEQK